MKAIRVLVGISLLALAAPVSDARAGEAQPGESLPDTAGRQARPDSLPGTPGLPKALEGQAEYDPARDLIGQKSFVGGRGRSFVIIDPANPQNLKGYVKFATGSKALADLVAEYTGLHTEVPRNEASRVNDLMEVPVVESGQEVRILERGMEAHIIEGGGGANQAGIQSMVEYLMRGGFVLGGLSSEIEHGLQKYGRLTPEVDFHSERLPHDHPIYHAFFDLTSELSPANRGPLRGDFQTTGYFIGGRLVSVTEMPGGERGTVNAVVFALTQEGGIARRSVRK
jgi:hypothetical protein